MRFMRLKDPALLDHLAEHNIGVESSLTSNVQTSTVADYASHPISAFLRHGIAATINTDDPGISAVTIAHEYEVAAVAAGLTPDEIFQAQRNALAQAFLSESEKAALLTAKHHPHLPCSPGISLICHCESTQRAKQSISSLYEVAQAFLPGCIKLLSPQVGEAGVRGHS